VRVPTLTDGVVVLNGFEFADVDAQLAGEDEEIARRFGWWPNRSTEVTVLEAIERWRVGWCENGSVRGLALRPVPNLELAGGCELRLDEHGVAAISWWVFPARRRLGLGSRMVTLIVDHAFSRMSVARVEAFIDPSNSASKALARRVGFVDEDVSLARTTTGRRQSHMLLAAMNAPNVGTPQG
jgi:RimJ/RimL family protein N-acetyltransferase